jgi:hypothetical protein
MLLGLCAWSSMGITSRDAALAEFGQHGGGVDSQVLADAGEGPAEVVQMDGSSICSGDKPQQRIGTL